MKRIIPAALLAAVVGTFAAVACDESSGPDLAARCQEYIERFYACNQWEPENAAVSVEDCEQTVGEASQEAECLEGFLSNCDPDAACSVFLNCESVCGAED